MKGFCAGQDTSCLLRYLQALRSDHGISLNKPGVHVQGQQVHGCHCHLKRGRSQQQALVHMLTLPIHLAREAIYLQ